MVGTLFFEGFKWYPALGVVVKIKVKTTPTQILHGVI